MNDFQGDRRPQERPHKPLRLRIPTPIDAISAHHLIRASAFVDDNSPYLYLLVCSHFAQTSVVAEQDGEILGLISAYIPPQQADTLFVWQVVVAPSLRRRGLAHSMLNFILQGAACQHVQYIDTTVTQDNEASRALFTRLATQLACPLRESLLFERTTHFQNLHDSEYLLRIGPFDRKALR